MKKQLLTLLAAVAVVGGAITLANAQGAFSVVSDKLQFQVGQTAAGQDTSSLLGMTTTSTVASTKDTTLWYSVANKRLSQPGFTAAAIAQIAINSTGTTDSVGYQIQWSNDKSKVSTTSQAYAVFTSGDTRKTADLIVPTAAADLGPFYRVILWANDTGGVVHTYSLNAVYRVAP